jgi:hypothetical protein
MKFEHTITRLFVAGAVYLAGIACSLEAAFPEPEVSETTSLQAHTGPHYPVGSNDGVQVFTKQTESAYHPDRLSVALSVIPDTGAITLPLVKAHGTRAPPRFH